MKQTISEDEVGRHMKARERMVRRAIAAGIKSAAHLGRAYLVKVTDERGKVYTGQFKASWKVVRRAAQIKTAGRAARATTTYDVVNTSPIAGIIELGARPHAVSAEGIDNLTRWAELKLGLGPKEARRAAFAIAAKIRAEGQRPTYMVRDSLPQLRVFLRGEVERKIRGQATKPSNADLRFGKASEGG